MIGVSCYGWVTLPADAQVPIHFGAGYNNFVSKRLGLIMHPEKHRYPAHAQALIEPG
jgi:hypothetical protein